MTEPSLAALARPLTSVARAVWPHLRRLQAERRAGQEPALGESNLLDRSLDEGLARLRGSGGVDDAWWRGLLNWIGHRYVTPDFRRAPDLQHWLARAQVQDDAKALARARIMFADTDDPATRGRLAAAYSERTGEAPQRAEGPIDVVVAILAASHLSRLTGGFEALGAMVQTGFAENRRDLQGLRQEVRALAWDPGVVEALDRVAENALKPILKRRSILPERAKAEIRSLAERAEHGDLRHASVRTRKKILYWAARLCAADGETAQQARGYRDQLLALDQHADTRIIDAFLAAADGDQERALRCARDLDDADGRSTFFGLLCRQRGDDAALLWLDDQPSGNPSLLSGVGWRNAVVRLALAGRWDEAADRLAALSEGHLDECPDLAFTEGAINAAMLLPSDLRRYALEMKVFHPDVRAVEGPSADLHRSRAKECFARAAALMEEIDLPGRAEAARNWLLWLRLKDPDPTVAATARDEVRQNLQDGRRAVDYIQFAKMPSIDFDGGPLERYLAQRERFGGLDERELVAKLALIELTKPPRDLAEFLEQEEGRLQRAVPLYVLTGMRVEALVADEQPAKAERLLEERVEVFPGRDVYRLRAMILARKGEDVRPRLEALYAETGSLIDVRNLIGCIWTARDWGALRPLVQELFQRERTASNALQVVECMRHAPDADEAEVATFLEENDDLVPGSLELASAKAWALFHIGRLRAAEQINDGLLNARNEANDLFLASNLAVQSGEWERLAAIVDRAWPGRERLAPRLLIHLASLAAETGDTRRAVDLAKLAAAKTPDDPHILLGAYATTVQLGQEAQADPAWLVRAHELSSDEGPVQVFEMRRVVEELMPAHAERSRRINKGLVDGELPIHVGAALLHVPLSRLLIELPQQHERERDRRLSAAIPIVSGARPPAEVRAEWTLGLDATSLMVLAGLGLLDKTFNAFHRVLLPPSVMWLLLNERRRARFHQPSRVEDAEEVRALIDAHRLEIMSSVPQVPEEVVAEVGWDLAELLEAASLVGGRVVRPFPIYKPTTYMDQEASLGDRAPLVVSTLALTQALIDAGALDRDAYERAVQYLRGLDSCPVQAADPALLQQPLYLDDLALTYLQSAGLLDVVCAWAACVRIHPSTRDEVNALCAARREGAGLEQAIDEVRVVLRDALAAGRASFLPHRLRDQEEVGSLAEAAPILTRLALDSRPCDAVCIDDRCLNRYPALTDQIGRSIPLVCGLDLLRHLQAMGLIDRRRRYAALHTLRQRGFMLIPVELDELEERLRGAPYDPDRDEMTETAELRMIRQSLERARSLDLVRQPAETAFLDQLRTSCVIIAGRLWRNDDLSAAHAAALSDWIWHKLAPFPLDWARSIDDPNGVMAPAKAAAAHLCLLLRAMPFGHNERGEAFATWVERSILEPLLPANATLVDELAERMAAEIERMSEDCS